MKAQRWHRIKSMGFVSLYDKVQHIPKGVFISVWAGKGQHWQSAAETGWAGEVQTVTDKPMPLVGNSAHGMLCRTKGMAEIFQLHFVLGQNLLKYKSAVCWRMETAVDWTWMAFISREDPTERGACSDNHIVGFLWLKEKNQIPVYISERLFYGQRHGSTCTTLASATAERNISKTKYKCFWALAGDHSNDRS